MTSSVIKWEFILKKQKYSQITLFAKKKKLNYIFYCIFHIEKQ